MPAYRLPSRQVLLFLVAIGVPCALLVGLSLRMLAQERELAEKRLADERRHVATEVRQELLSRLERFRLEALSVGAAGMFKADRQQPIAVVAEIENDRLMLPWDRRAGTETIAAALDEPKFADAIRLGEHGEFVARQFDGAVAAYRRAVAEARLPEQTAFAQLLVARALAKGTRLREADALYRNVLRVPSRVVDEQGIPFALYAARRLLDSRDTLDSDQGAVLEVLRTALSVEPHLPPAAVYMLGDVTRDVIAHAASDAVRQAARDVERNITAVGREVEQALALQNAFPTLLAKSATASGPGLDPTWVPFGDPGTLWLAGVVSTTNGRLVVAVRADPILTSLQAVRMASTGPDGNRLLKIAANSSGEPLGQSLPGLSLTFQAGDGAARAGAASLQRSFYLAALGLVVSMALFGAYLFWRDVRREVRVAEMRSQFVSSVSHELKTPLTAIRMFAETLLMRRSTGPDIREEYLETIVNESERLTRLLNNVLDFSKIEQGKKTYRLEPHSLGSIVQAAAKAMDYPLSQQGFELRIAIAEDVPLVAADPDAIEQAILNLLSNAMKYSGQGRVIDVQLTKEADRAVISVTDRGLGIPLDEQARIFEKFYRISSPDQERIPGTGLGLTLVDHVVKAHGGDITVRSAPGEGSTFSIVLPLTDGDASEATPARELA